ncbi:hypothetical protein [Marinoscillum furvescens]|uniref:Uncharacterized protein n=1 Tax=Marinoscillum furvescens DSM 4134 TaxID=1122208 RepID=A0A3D9LH25_MARFU|nr:hypothetical protein [Marinoscillum furvescens]REE05691.1 hypothetical protein C7460_101208 [Marinoscillum furvescens DSM 4134]
MDKVLIGKKATIRQYNADPALMDASPKMTEGNRQYNAYITALEFHKFTEELNMTKIHNY